MVIVVLYLEVLSTKDGFEEDAILDNEEEEELTTENETTDDEDIDSEIYKKPKSAFIDEEVYHSNVYSFCY